MAGSGSVGISGARLRGMRYLAILRSSSSRLHSACLLRCSSARWAMTSSLYRVAYLYLMARPYRAYTPHHSTENPLALAVMGDESTVG